MTRKSICLLLSALGLEEETGRKHTSGWGGVLWIGCVCGEMEKQRDVQRLQLEKAPGAPSLERKAAAEKIKKKYGGGGKERGRLESRARLLIV